MSSIRDFFKKKKKLDNKGEAMILMIVAIGIIMFLGLSLLYATATAFMIRNTERHSEETFNSADTGVDFIKNRLTEVESKAAEQGYAQVLNLYSESKSDQANFKKSFFDELGKIVVSENGDISIKDTPGSGEEVLFPGGSSSAISSYNSDAIKYLLKANTASSGDKCELQCDGTAKLSDDQDAVTLKGIKLTYTRKDGYVTNVSTDIKLKVPDITVSTPAQGFERNALTGFSCVADQGLKLISESQGITADAGSFEGSIYTGSVLSQDKALVVSKNGKVIIGRTRNTSEDANGNVTYYSERTDGRLTARAGGGGITVESNGELWAQDICLENNMKLSSEKDSNIYVANDMTFSDGGQAVIKGSYFGFGNGTRVFDTGTTANNSSSIIFNDIYKAGKIKSSFDLSEAQSVMLAGRSFIMGDNADSNQIEMGSSITAKSEQKAYLIPTGTNGILGNNSNPQTVSAENVGSKEEEIKTLVSTNLSRKIYGMANTLGTYNPSVKVLSYKISNTDNYKQYYFFEFNSTANANAYFKDYFEHNSAQIEDYLNQYADTFELKSSILKTAGTGLSNDNNKLTVTDAASADDITLMNTQSSKYLKQYENYSDTLDKNSSGDKTPFYSLIDIDSLHKIVGTRKNEEIPIAWWVDKNKAAPVYNEDKIYDLTGNRILVVLYKPYYKDSNYFMYVNENEKIYKMTLETVGGSIKTSPDSSDGSNFAIIQNGSHYSIKQCNGLDNSDISNIVAIASDKTEQGSSNIDIADMAAGYVVWTDGTTPHVCQKSDKNVNFYVCDGDLKIKNEFYGLLMCSGTLQSEESKVYLSNDLGSKILAKTHIWSANTGGTKSSSSEDWTLGKMVVYENWKKN